jgi:hypothetical protein
MTTRVSLWRKALLAIALLSILLCPILFLAGNFFPSALGFLEPVLCPAGMHLGSKTESLSDPRGNVTDSYGVCTDGREQVDVTDRLLVILFGVAILGVVLLVAWALTGTEKKPEAPKLRPE